MHKFTDIGQFRNVVKAVRSDHDYQGKDEDGKAIYRHTSPYPSLVFRGTVKLHGTNAAIVKYADGHYEFQSRQRVLSLGSDNAGFYAAMQLEPYQAMFNGVAFDDYCAVYGEWCGGNIQSGVGIAQCEKMFIPFAVKIDGEYNHDALVGLMWGGKQVYDFDNFREVVDFNAPEESQPRLAKFTEDVEAECPVTYALTGKRGVGEGVVWEGWHDDERYIFKVKGEKHSVSKVKTLAAVDPEEIAKMREFVEYAVTENRLLQGISVLQEQDKELCPKSTGDFLGWVIRDIIKEEEDVLVANKLDVKKVGKYLSEAAKNWWFAHLDALAMEVPCE